MNTFKHSQARERESAKEQGFYDGRFKTKVVKDKKKELSRNWARGKGILRGDPKIVKVYAGWGPPSRVVV